LNNKRSFTLIEISIALLVLAVGLVSLLALFPVGFDASRKSSDFTEVSTLVQGKLEELKRDGFASLANSSGTFSSTIYNWSVVIVDISSDLRKVTLTVSWTRRGINFSEPFVTYIPKYVP